MNGYALIMRHLATNEMKNRLPAVLKTLYLLLNEGY